MRNSIARNIWPVHRGQGWNVTNKAEFTLLLAVQWNTHRAPDYPGVEKITEEPLDRSSDIVEIAASIVAAYVSNNPLPVSELPALITKVHGSVSELASGATSVSAPAAEVEKPSPAQIRRSVQNESIVSFIDGKSYKTLKRHLAANGLDPRSYRERYGLPADYPMVAPEYAERRSALAKAIGLGRAGAVAESAPKGRRKAA
ncbi:Ros/MucR family transcriptional regulator [Methylobacterium sp. CM6257]